MYRSHKHQTEDERQNSTPLHWTPQYAGEALAGTLIDIKKVRVLGGRKCRAAIIRDEDGHEWSVLLGPKVLKREWRKQNPRVGSQVEIEYLGERESRRSGEDYKLFEVIVS